MNPYFYYPDVSKSITALACSILASYNLEILNPTLPEADAFLAKEHRNVVLILLDGLGYDILCGHLSADSFLRRNLHTTISSVFPPTTTAAATALETGLFPSQSGWLGWSVYWPELRTNVNLYPNTTPDGHAAAKEHLGRTYLATPSLTDRIGCAGTASAETLIGTLDTVSDVLERIAAHCRQPGQHYVYGYFNQPDGLLHKYGCHAACVSAFLREFDRQLESSFKRWSDTLLLISADHGFIDADSLCLEDYPDLMDTLEIPPSIEPRALNFFIKPGCHREFLKLFQTAVGDAYTVYAREEICASGMFGPPPEHCRFRSMLGDYLAVARTERTLFPNRGYLNAMIAAHGGMTPSELTVPLIIAES